MNKHFAKILILCFEEKTKIIIRQRRKSKQKWAGKHLHFRNNWLLCSGQRFWEIAAATIEDLAFGIRSSRDKKMGTGPIFWHSVHRSGVSSPLQKWGLSPFFCEYV